MRGDHTILTLTTTYNEATGETQPLFSFPVQVCKATSSVDVKLDSATASGSTYSQVYRDDATGEIIEERKDLVKGIREGEGFKAIPAESLKAIDEQTKLPDMRVEKAVPLAEVPFERATGFYFLQSPPKGGAHKAYRLTYEALAAKGKKHPARALRVKFTSRTRQKLAAVYADTDRKCLVAVTLTFAADMREPDEAVLAPQKVEVEEKQVEMARTVIAALENPVDPKTKQPVDAGDWNTPVDDAIEQKRELVEQAVAGKTIEAPTTPVAETVEADGIEALLEESIAVTA